ncbi:hypothetical protein AAFN60_04915 [Roseibacillus persicicus]|uniref:hypothetical protein n=1 Tax=Roseibacillus persicicus TaxID=454148 RepID=UPI00398ADE81
MVYFVCRSEYEKPHGKRIVEFPDCENLLAWFQKYWLTREELIAAEPKLAQADPEDDWEWCDEIVRQRAEVFGGNFYDFSRFLFAMLDRDRPKSLRDVEEFISSFEGQFSEGSIAMFESAIQVDTNDDEIDLAWYLFDDDFSNKYPERTSFLIHKPVELPSEVGSSNWAPPFPVQSIVPSEDKTDGATYCCFFSSSDGMTITDIDGCFRVPTRLPNLGPWLAEHAVQIGYNADEFIESAWSDNLILLRAFAIFAEEHSFDQALAKFDEVNSELAGWFPRTFQTIRERSKKPEALTTDTETVRTQLEKIRQIACKAGETNPHSFWTYSSGESIFQTTPHLKQVLFTEIASGRPPSPLKTETVKHWIFFDDLWASANPALAESILRYGRGDDVLSS